LLQVPAKLQSFIIGMALQRVCLFLRGVQTAKLEVQWALMPQREQEEGVATDAWSAGKSTAGQMALRVAGAEDWAPVYRNAQALSGGASQALKKVRLISSAALTSMQRSARGGLQLTVVRNIIKLVLEGQTVTGT
jgi:hypothetical protein